MRRTYPLEPTLGLLLVVCATPVFLCGLWEDLTKSVRASYRLLTAMIAAGAGCLIFDTTLTHLDLSGTFDLLLSNWWFALLFTSFAVAGVANAINIIDGYNGLAGGVAIIGLAGLSLVSLWVSDFEIALVSLSLAAAILGFLVWNWPLGRIFLGDGGAYFIGFMMGMISVLLVGRHPEVSPWFPPVLLAYPIWETLFSAYRKRVLRGKPAGQPDGLHAHMLVFKRVARLRQFSQAPHDLKIRNAMTSPYLWAFAALPGVAAVAFWNNSLVLAALGFTYGFFYNYLYRRLVRFRVPSWVILRSAWGRRRRLNPLERDAHNFR